ncbi:MAG: DUF3426 domain-containing protein [Pseudomonadota bacterium]
MFINCPYCRTLVSTDPVTDLPPTHCPHCMSLLRRDDTVEDAADTEGDGAPLDLVALMNTPVMDTPVMDRPVASASALNTPALETDTKTVTQTGALTDEKAPAERQTDIARDDSVIEPTPEPGDATAVDTGTTTAPATLTPPPPAPGKRGSRAMPSFARVASAANKGPRERWIVAVVVALAVLLILQLLLADRARLSADARWRPTLHVLCAALFCELPPWREPTAFTLLQRDVRQHPSTPGALRVSATFRNDARWSQPWPRLRLTLSDANGRPAGARDFRAEDYLGGPASQPELASGESATVAMDILEPAAQIVGFDFNFR